VDSKQLYGGIEAGGTKFVCLVGSGPEHVLEQVRFPTTSPAETLGRTIEFFRPYTDSGRVRSIGVGCFGPIDLDRSSPKYGHITSTPKAGWQDTDVVGSLQSALHIPVSFDMDVNTAALAEYRWGASQGIDPCLYLTVGTGIGGGYIIDGKPLVGMLNLEMGHIHVPHDRTLDPFVGNCPFHGDCFEGLASGPAVESRLGARGETLPADHPFWELEASYIAAALATFILTLSPRRIVIGGGVMQRDSLFPVIRSKVREGLNGYVQHRSVLREIDRYILPPGLGSLSGSLGAIALAALTDSG
jgi:fructokinase